MLRDSLKQQNKDAMTKLVETEAVFTSNLFAKTEELRQKNECIQFLSSKTENLKLQLQQTEATIAEMTQLHKNVRSVPL